MPGSGQAQERLERKGEKATILLGKGGVGRPARE